MASTVANATPGRRGRALTPKEFMPDFDGEPRQSRMSDKEIDARLRLFVMAHNQALEERAGKQ